MMKFLDRFGFWFSLFICILAYLFLAYKNPFGDSSLISNFEPYPDTLLYSFPAWNWVRGNGWDMGVDGRFVKISVPNTYGVLLVPLMWLFKDIRSFYFTNLVFGMGTLLFFMLALRNFLGKKKWYLVGFLGFLLATNFYFFNQPQLVMAENVNYFLVGFFLYLISLDFKWKHIWLMLGLVIFTLILKNTNVVLGAGFALSFLLKIIIKNKFNLKKIFILFLIVLGLSLPLVVPKFMSLNLAAFGWKFFPTNFRFYFSCLSGDTCRNLWYWQKMISWDMVGLFLLGSFLMTKNKNKRMLWLELFLPILFMVLAMSFFMDTEGRHVEILVPLMLMIGAFGLEKLLDKFKFPVLVVIGCLGLNLFLTSYQPNDFKMKIISLKEQVGLNFRHREDPWNYLCLEMINDFMKDKPQSSFGSFLPLYFFDAYGLKINYLPLANDQDFMNRKGSVNYFSKPVKDIYEQKIKDKEEIYLSDYYASNGRDYWRWQWNDIVSLGDLEKVWQSPLDNCNIYKLSPIKE